MSDKSDQKSKLAQELLELLKGDIQARSKPKTKDSDEPTGPRRIVSPTDTMATSHQKRDNKRFSIPVLRVNIGTSGYNTIDWSLGGLQVKDYVGVLKQFARVKISVSEGKSDSTYYAVECRVARMDVKSRTLSLQFQNTTRGMFDWLSGLQMMQTRKRG
ncbi:MAG: hypothetical protein WDO24_18565 [Pseudomonadota bacterium]